MWCRVGLFASVFIALTDVVRDWWLIYSPLKGRYFGARLERILGYISQTRPNHHYRELLLSCQRLFKAFNTSNSLKLYNCIFHFNYPQLLFGLGSVGDAKNAFLRHKWKKYSLFFNGCVARETNLNSPN